MSTNTSAEVETVETTTEQLENVTVADTGAGLLVFAEADLPGKKLVGFADVSDWSAIRDALRARGLGVGAVTNLPTFDLNELPDSEGEPAVLGDLGKVPAAWCDDEGDEVNDDSRTEPTRSEPADFGGGETTGVQDL